MKKNNDTLRLYLIIASIVWFLSLFPALVFAMFSPMMFDAPGSESNALTIALVTAIWGYPFVSVISMVLAWILFTKQKNSVSFLLSLLPPLWVILNILLWVGIAVFCDGTFTC